MPSVTFKTFNREFFLPEFCLEVDACGLCLEELALE
jgi:hypothetical protein